METTECPKKKKARSLSIPNQIKLSLLNAGFIGTSESCQQEGFGQLQINIFPNLNFCIFSLPKQTREKSHNKLFWTDQQTWKHFSKTVNTDESIQFFIKSSLM